MHVITLITLNVSATNKYLVQEKYGHRESNGVNLDARDDSDSTSESEDDEGALVTEQLDAEILYTLKAIQSKDPRVYDKNVKFYALEDASKNGVSTESDNKSKPMYLKDYHRQNLMDEMDGRVVVDEVPTYADEQATMKQNILQQMHGDEQMADEGSEGDDFLVRKPAKVAAPSRSVVIAPVPDISTADRDPETFLSNFMASKAWKPAKSGSNFQAFESDDDDEDKHAEQFENAYNMRFEDPQHANEKLLSHSREVASKYSVRRGEPKGRKKHREYQKAQQEAEKGQREEERARYRNLKIEEAQAKLNKFKDAAGLRREVVLVEEWSNFLDDGWDDEKWDEEMAKRFGDAYYAERETVGSDVDLVEDTSISRKRKTARKPKWDDDIDVGDIIPGFEQTDRAAADEFVLSDMEDDRVEKVEQQAPPKKKSKRSIEEDRAAQKKQARKDRRKIEELVDQSLFPELPSTSIKQPSRFQYRATSPAAFGLSAHEILLADDAALNQFVGLKKLASFREQEKKNRDKKKLGKKARLRQWRKDTFGDENGPKTSLQEHFGIPSSHAHSSEANGTNNGVVPDSLVGLEGKKHKRSRKSKKSDEGKKARL